MFGRAPVKGYPFPFHLRPTATRVEPQLTRVGCVGMVLRQLSKVIAVAALATAAVGNPTHIVHLSVFLPYSNQEVRTKGP